MKRKNSSLLATILLILAIAGSASAVTIHNGTVKETTSAGRYTYMLVENDGHEQWVAIPKTLVKAGEKVNYIDGMTMKNFESKGLNRTFDTIIFSEGLTDNQKTTEGHDMFAEALVNENNEQQTMETSPGSAGAVSPFKNEMIDKATGNNAYSVEELFTKREELKGKTIKVRGRITKINMEIMGKNWVHLQDGTGNPMNNSHDLVITTTEKPEEGAIVTMQGKVVVNQDFGFSYQYDLLIEQAKIVQ